MTCTVLPLISLSPNSRSAVEASLDTKMDQVDPNSPLLSLIITAGLTEVLCSGFRFTYVKCKINSLNHYFACRRRGQGGGQGCGAPNTDRQDIRNSYF
jgi:hypothetical protein